MAEKTLSPGTMGCSSLILWLSGILAGNLVAVLEDRIP
jgi:hypothetical protein